MEEPLTDEDIKDQSLKKAFGRYFTRISIESGIKEVRSIFLESYNYLLSKLLIDQGVSIDSLLSNFQQLFSSFDEKIKSYGPKREQYDFYIRQSFIKYMDFAKKCFFYPYILNRHVKRKYSPRNADWNRNIKFYGPAFLMRAVSMKFLLNDVDKEEKGITPNPLIFKKVGKPEISFDQWGQSYTFNFNYRQTSIAQDIAYCLAVENFLSQKNPDLKIPVSLEHYDFLQVNPALKTELEEEVKKVIEQMQKRYRNATRLSSMPTQEDLLQLRIVSRPNSSYELYSLHILISVDYPALEGIIQLRFHFFNQAGEKLLFDYLDDYSYNEQYNAYYFLPAPDAKLPDSYPHCTDSIVRIFPVDKTTADIILIVA